MSNKDNIKFNSNIDITSNIVSVLKNEHNDFNNDKNNFGYTENSILELLGQKAECNYYLTSF